MATERESTTTLSTPVQPSSVAPLPDGDCLIRLGGEPLRYAPIPYAALSEKLDELDRVSGDASMFRDAHTHLATIAAIDWYGIAYQIDGTTVRPDPKRTGWPWRCTCGDAPCWHAAFCEAVELVREQQAEANEAALAA